ncbi:hypothetical protein ANN_03990 [Periplaneta americana]|uniref:HAT C-terminal dimerisation domain-containing protein n=1 Tax=Periplaneta americana TaxID=6978 RepID=A0ABQ8T7C0_PERAM|nr:hypothetical protein ANN_03990 [Periplaneta americana]
MAGLSTSASVERTFSVLKQNPTVDQLIHKNGLSGLALMSIEKSFLQKLRKRPNCNFNDEVIKNKERGMLTDGVVLFMTARPHTARDTQNLISKSGWEQIDHSPYSPDLAPSDFHLFLHHKKFLCGQRIYA